MEQFRRGELVFDVIDEQPETTADLLLDWFATHPAASRT